MALLPKRRRKNSRRQEDGRRFPRHCAWVRGHSCSVPGCLEADIECAHVRRATDGGTGIKPSDWWTISLCADHHAEQHAIGESAFEKRYCIDLLALAAAFARLSPYRDALNKRNTAASLHE